jgi:hypothetical protein
MECGGWIKKRHFEEKLLGLMKIFMFLIVIMVSWVYS